MSPPRRAPHPFGDARTQRTGLPHSNAPGLLPRAAPRLSEPAWTRRVEARILHGTGDTMADAGGRPDAQRGLARQAPILRHPLRRRQHALARQVGSRAGGRRHGRPAHAPPCPWSWWRWRVAWQSRRMSCAAVWSRCAPNAGERDPQQACGPLALEESDLCASNPSRPHGATRSAPIPAPSVAARPPMMRRTIGPVPVARSRSPPWGRARSSSRRPGGGPTRRKHNVRLDHPLVTPRPRVVEPLRGSPSRS